MNFKYIINNKIIYLTTKNIWTIVTDILILSQVYQLILFYFVLSKLNKSRYSKYKNTMSTFQITNYRLCIFYICLVKKRYS